MSMNDATIIAGLAAHLQAKTKPSGYTLRAVHQYPPDNLAVVPAAVIVPGDDSINYGAANRQAVLTLNIVIYIQPQADMARKYQDLMVWRTWLRDCLLDAAMLNSTDSVAQASIISTSIGTDTYADQDYLTITANAEISVVEVYNASA